MNYTERGHDVEADGGEHRRSVATQALVFVPVVLLIAVLGWLGWSWYESRLPGRYNVMDFGTVDYGGGPSHPAGHDAPSSLSVADLHGSHAGTPDVRLTLTAQTAPIQLASGRVIDAWTFNGQVPGPPIRARRGDLVEVTLRNRDITAGVTIHWHGVDVPNAEDGVAGVTQDAVRPGESYVYRFRVAQQGSFWYHSHQVGSQQVRRGLYGLLTFIGRGAGVPEVEVPVITHSFPGGTVIGRDDTVQRRKVRTGQLVRLRLVNTDSGRARYVVAGASFRVTAIDGTDLNGPPPITRQLLELGAGGRYDVTFTMPRTPVVVRLGGATAGIVFSTGHGRPVVAMEPKQIFDPATYGRRRTLEIDPTGRFDRRFTLTITRKPGFFDGRPGLQWAINGEIYPRTPMFVVRKGEVVRITIVNKTGAFHPMHLHGHHMLVLSRNGRPTSGSPWWIDTLNVRPNERYEAAFRADNPGLWMDHCHNLGHAAQGLTMHVAYEGVRTPFEAGDEAGNHPE